MIEKKIISKGQEYIILFDEEDLLLVEACGNLKIDKGYVRTSLGKNQIDEINNITNLNIQYKERKDTGAIQVTKSLHRLILGVEDSKIQVDHINNNPLDNRKENLRLASHSQNQRNKNKTRKNKTGYKGVEYVPKVNKSNPYKMKIQKNGKVIQKYFSTAEKAALAYDKAARELFGEYANLNFEEETT